MNPRFSLLATTLCAFSFLFATLTASAAPAKKETVVGTVQIEDRGTVRINGRTESNGATLRCGDLIETTVRVIAVFYKGPSYVIDPASRVRVVCSGNGPVALMVIYGGVHPVGSEPDDTIDPLPYLAAFGFGNFSFPSIGGNSSSSAGKIPVTNASGVVIGYALTDANGRVVAYTDLSGRVLAVTAPNGTPVSGIFGPGAILL